VKIVAISGLGADKRVFESLKLDYDIQTVDWITPNKAEGIEDYAIRIIAQNGIKSEVCVLGVSFGGLVAVEISKLLHSKLTILISSAAIKTDLPRIYRLIGGSKIMQVIPSQMLKPPKLIAMWTFGAKNKDLLFDILDDTDLHFAKWAINQLVCWNNTTQIDNCIKISGTKDRLIPIKRGQNTIEIKGGAHFMIVDKADEISQIINHVIEQNSVRL